MEILIIGGILVALMAYASTKIKRNAAAAFEEEAVETDEFALLKPEGFLAPVTPEEYLAFYAYSRSFGEAEGAEKMRQGQIKLKVQAGRSLSEIVKEIKAAFDETLLDERESESVAMLTGKRTESDVEKIYYHKLIAAGEKVYDLEMSVLGDYEETFKESARKLRASFRVK